MGRVIKGIVNIARRPLVIQKEVVLNYELDKWESHTDYLLPNGVSIESVDAGNVNDIEKFRGSYSVQEFRRFHAEHCLGAYAYVRGAVIGHLWMEINNTQDQKLSNGGTLLLRGEGETWYAHVAEEYRGKRIHGNLKELLYGKSRELGCKTLISRIREDNEASIRANTRFGMHLNGKATTVTIASGLVTVHKSCDRGHIILRPPLTRKGIGVGWSRAHGLKLMLPSS